MQHRYGDDHFLRDVAKPVLEADSHAKVQMRKEVRGLRGVERAVLEHQRRSTPDGDASDPAASLTLLADPATSCVAEVDTACDGAWNDHAAVRGIVNDDQGGPLQPPGVVHGGRLEGSPRLESRCSLDEQKGGSPRSNSAGWPACIDRGLDHVRAEQEPLRDYVEDLQEVAATLEPGRDDITTRRQTFEALIERFKGAGDPVRGHMARVMIGFLAGLFVGGVRFEAIRDNLELERWFRLPKSHERRIDGRRHAGVRIVQDGPTLLMALDAHVSTRSPSPPRSCCPIVRPDCRPANVRR